VEVTSELHGFAWGTVVVVLHVALRYLALIFVPLGQTAIPAVPLVSSPLDTRVAVVALAGGVLASFAWRTRTRVPQVALGLIWFFAALTPAAVLSLLAQTGQLMAEHRAYFASCGIFFAAAALARHAAEQRWLGVRTIQGLALAMVLVVAACTTLTIRRNAVWNDPIRLWSEAIEAAPNTPAAHYALGFTYHDRGDCTAAKAPYRRAIALNPLWSDAYLGLADCERRTGDVAAAGSVLRAGAAQLPGNARIRLALAFLEERQFRRPDEARRLCAEALSIDPSSAQARDCVERNRPR
jgi:tetratricopeptide (TPR) repeat protein